jgi:hypothetical protein
MEYNIRLGSSWYSFHVLSGNDLTTFGLTPSLFGSRFLWLLCLLLAAYPRLFGLGLIT